MFVRRLIATFALLATLTCGADRAAAQNTPSPEALQAANELFALLSSDMMGQLATQVTAAFWPAVERDLVGRVDAGTLGELRKEFERIQAENLSEVMKDAPVIYARRFTVSELREITAFYRTPTGQKMRREMPQLMGELVALIMPRIQDIETKTRDGFLRVLKERGYAK